MEKMEKMTPAQEAHLQRVKDEFCALVDPKYRKGQEEHGGDLFMLTMGQLLDNAIEEAIDQVVFLLSMKEKLNGNGGIK